MHTTWRKSSYSAQEGGACVELASLGTTIGVQDGLARLFQQIKANHGWRKSSYTGQEGGTCVELAALDNTVGVRDSTDPHGPVLQFGRLAVAGLVGRIKAGELDR